MMNVHHTNAAAPPNRSRRSSHFSKRNSWQSDAWGCVCMGVSSHAPNERADLDLLVPKGTRENRELPPRTPATGLEVRYAPSRPTKPRRIIRVHEFADG